MGDNMGSTLNHKTKNGGRLLIYSPSHDFFPNPNRELIVNDGRWMPFLKKNLG